jgi:TM2 domain-containing membrane protein YozV
MGKGKTKLIALLLSGLIFPGSGQLYLKKKLKGVLIMICSSIFVAYPLIKFLIALNSAIRNNITDPLSIYQNMVTMDAVYSSQKGTIYISSLFLLGIWLFGIIDILLYKKTGGAE